MPLSIQPIVRGIVYAVIAALVLSGIIGILTNISGIPESEIINNGIFICSIFFGGIISARMAGTKGLYYGISVAVGFLLVLLLVSTVMLPDPFNWLAVAEKTFYALLSGAVGGAVGVALK